MRIVGGEWSGRRLLSPGAGVRPTQDRVRQILFDIIGSAVLDAAVLDLYAGTGALGLEALSRGASRAVFVEADPGARGVLRRNCELLGAAERVRIIGLTVTRALDLLEREGTSFRWVLADPPYGGSEATRLLSRLSGSTLLAEGGAVVLEARAAASIPERSGRLERRRERKVGETVLLFYRQGPPLAAEEGTSEGPTRSGAGME